MHRWLFLVALIIVLATGALWWAGGAHRGWTKTSVLVPKVDEITEIVYHETEDRFVPGMDFLGSGLAVAGALAVIGLVVQSRRRRLRA